MIRSFIVTLAVIISIVSAPVASAQPACGYSPDELVRQMLNLTSKGMAEDQAAKTIVQDVYNNCSDFQTIFDNFQSTYGG